MRQTSPEAEGIFDEIIHSYRSFFLDYAALFLCNLGNLYAEGGQKSIPNIPMATLKKILGVFPTTRTISTDDTLESMVALPPFGLGLPSSNTISNYYLGARITRDEIAYVTKAVCELGIEPENTRVRKIIDGSKPIFEVLQASIEAGAPKILTSGKYKEGDIRLVQGDHAEELAIICFHLRQAQSYVANETQNQMLARYIKSFETGSLDAYRESQRFWVTDVTPNVESILGFVESYTDPYGVRAQWEGAVCLADVNETKKMEDFMSKSADFAQLLPWATSENGGKGPFEKEILSIPQFTILHVLACCCGGVWEASNLPNYNDIRDTLGSKNLLLANRMNANRNLPYRKNLHVIRFVATVIHELLGHGTGKLLSETEPGKYNFDNTKPPISPLTGEPVTSWYLPGQTWTSVFEDIATSVEECRAILMSAYLIDNKDLLEVFGYNDHSELTGSELIYLSYAHLGVEGIRSLEQYNAEEKVWNQAHSQGYFGIFKQLLLHGDGLFEVKFDPSASTLTVHVDRSKILSHGKPALGDFMNKLHVWRCIANVQPCREFYEALTAVDGVYEEWRQLVCTKPESRMKFVQANTFLREGVVEVKEYAESNEGIIQSWVERAV
ncbi:peptidase M49, dipeptidyl-peptidase III [Plenodomus tracheiphilus IPT5]|uniref:Peptidase M49, dipeptidyl-peptidase III n=1 Tax=Plenodomus tracheiphilus IPT5 TaxID=1408161 RepID=A0A6A7B529_9PLEO|nr:peptidase M49, dipeptidyl-peptidase III [Plenodomus tracheiphilus IPT5]